MAKNKRLLFFATIYLGVLFAALSLCHRPPGPILAGDTYQNLAKVQSMLSGRNVLQDPAYPSETDWYPWYMHLFAAYIITSTASDPLVLFTYLNFFSLALFFIGTLLVSKKISGQNRDPLLFSALIFVSPLSSFIYDGSAVSTNAFTFALLPFFFYFLASFLSTGKEKHALLTGLFLGTLCLTHATNLLLLLFLPLLWLYLGKKKQQVSPLGKTIALGALIASLFYVPLLAKYGLGFSEEGLAERLLETHRPQALERLGETLGLKASVSSIGTLLGAIGLAGLFGKNKKTTQQKTVECFALLFLALYFADYVTMPLFGLFYLPSRLVRYLHFAYLFTGFSFLSGFSERKKINKVFLATTISALAVFSLFLQAYNDPGFYAAREGSFEPFENMAQWIKQNTEKDDLFLAYPSFAMTINALTARPILLTDPGHAHPFLPFSDKYADIVGIYYSNSSLQAYNVLEKYGVKYLAMSSFKEAEIFPLQGLLKFDKDPLHFKQVYNYGKSIYIYEIGEFSENQTVVYAGQKIDIRAQAPGDYAKVWAVVTAPSGKMFAIEMLKDSTGSFFSEFGQTTEQGPYLVTIVTVGQDGSQLNKKIPGFVVYAGET